MLSAKRLDLGNLRFAKLGSIRASGVKSASGRRIYGTGDISLKNDPLASVFSADHGDGREKRLGIGMGGSLENIVLRADLYYLSEIKYRDPVADMLYYGKIV